MVNPDSQRFRARLARLVSPLRRVRPTVPFYQLAAHRIPTLWSLYRGLLRHARGENIRFRIATLFKKYQHLTSPRETHDKLDIGHKWLDIFLKAKQGDKKLRNILDRYDRIIGTKREKERWKHLVREAFEWQAKLRRRPILTGTSLRPSLYNRPMPRLSPQPEHISMMIFKRRRARQRRMALYAMLQATRDDLRREFDFEANLSILSNEPFERVFLHLDEWDRPLREQLQAIRATFVLDGQRQLSPYTDELLAALKSARREKIINKTREGERERRGEVLACTYRRSRKGPPAHILQTMQPEHRKVDKIARSPSEGGYVGLIKQRLGFRLRSSFPRDLNTGIQYPKPNDPSDTM